jgi:hypothetical protein
LNLDTGDSFVLFILTATVFFVKFWGQLGDNLLNESENLLASNVSLTDDLTMDFKKFVNHRIDVVEASFDTLGSYKRSKWNLVNKLRLRCTYHVILKSKLWWFVFDSKIDRDNLSWVRWGL